MSPLRFAVVGTGALGGFYGALLARAGADVHFLLRSDFDHVRSRGLRVESKLGDFQLPRVQAYREVTEMPACDVTLLCLKTTENHRLGELLPPLASGGGRVLVLQNGLCPERDAAAVVGAERVVGGVCFLCSNKAGPGHIRHLDYGRIVMGQHRAADDPARGVPEDVARIADFMRGAGIDAQCCEDQWHARWKKLMWNVPFNGLSVVLAAKSDALVGDPASAALAESLMRDVQRSAAACQRHIPDAAIEEMMENTRRMVPYDSSMRLDYLAGRPMEVESIFGDPVRAAEAAGYRPAQMRMLFEQLAFLDSRQSAPDLDVAGSNG
jgi:2-dehydropantoate 2-reductase